MKCRKDVKEHFGFGGGDRLMEPTVPALVLIVVLSLFSDSAGVEMLEKTC